MCIALSIVRGAKEKKRGEKRERERERAHRGY
jgi:hypothetical protein